MKLEIDITESAITELDITKVTQYRTQVITAALWGEADGNFGTYRTIPILFVRDMKKSLEAKLLRYHPWSFLKKNLFDICHW